MLSPAQKRTLQFIESYLQAYGQAPTLSQIAQGIGIQSKGVVHRYVQALTEQGYLETVPGRHRGLRLASSTSTSYIPLLGKIAAGSPIEAIEDKQVLDLNTVFIGNNLYALVVKGDSMIEAGIKEGDTIICTHAQTARAGEIVVALIDQEQATLKYFQANQDGTITLIPANASLKPMTYAANRVQIQGIYVGLIRTTP